MSGSEAQPLASYDLGEHSLLFRPRSFDKLVIREIWTWDDYFLTRLAGPTQGTIVDVGAHIGAFAVRAALLFPGARVLALEPVRENFDLLEQNLRRNDCRGVSALNVALAAASGWVDVYLNPKNTAGHSTVLTGVEGRRVQALSFADLFREQKLAEVHLLKVDCEGAEYEILSSEAFAALAERVKNVVFEHHAVDGQSFEALKSRMEALGFGMTSYKQGYVPDQGTALFQRGGR
jgi:FkbM family methyltransferase